MSESEHSMITRSMKKKLELIPPNNADNNDELDEQGNIKGLIDYECDEPFDNDMFQKELRRLRGGNLSPSIHSSPTKKARKKLKQKGNNKLPNMLASYMLMNLFNSLGDKKIKKKNRRKDNILMNIMEAEEEDIELSESDVELSEEEEEESEDEEYIGEEYSDGEISIITASSEEEEIEMDEYDEKYIEMEDDLVEEEDNDFNYFQTLVSEEKEKHLTELQEIKDIRNTAVPLKFKILESDMDLKTKSIAIGNIEKLSEMDVSTGEYCKMDKWINGLINIPFGKINELPINNENTFDEKREYLVQTQKKLDEAIYGHQDAKMHILQVIGKWIKNPQSQGNVLAIQGPMGNGKTTLVKEGIAKAINRPFAFIALGGASDSSFFDGHSYTYEGSHWGRIVDILIESKCMNPIIYFDELDKISESAKGDEIVHLLTHLTDPSQNSLFQDNYFPGIHLNLSKALFIFSFNDESKLDRILKDRMYVINTKGFKPTDKISICRNYVLPELLDTFLFSKEEILFPDDTILHIIERFTGKEEGVRNLKRCLETIISKINIYYLSQKKEEKEEEKEEGKEEEKENKEKEEEKDDLPMTFKIKDFKLPLTVTPEIVKELLPVQNGDQPPEHMYM